jgi:hypothetical protein
MPGLQKAEALRDYRLACFDTGKQRPHLDQRLGEGLGLNPLHISAQPLSEM